MQANRQILHVLIVAGACLGPAPAAAQAVDDGGPDPALVRVRIGAIMMNPTISLPNVGVDTNVFNEPDSAPPKRDFTMTVAPKADMWLRLGQSWLAGTIAEDVVWYQEYESERSTNHFLSAEWRAPLNRVKVTTGASWLSTRSRPGYEIDERVRRHEPAFTAGMEVQAFGQTFFGARGSWRDVSYEAGQTYEGVNLKEELDRRIATAALTIRQDLTPLTSITLSAGRTDERFDSPLRRSESDDYNVAVNFAPGGLLRGSARVGFTNFKPESADVPGYKGSTAEVNLTYDFRNSTRFNAIVNRAIEFSYDNEQPYYVLTGTGGIFAQRIGGPVDVVARASTQRLEYQNRSSSESFQPDRTDRVRSYGGGVGVRLGQELRLGFNVDRERRTSILPDHEYDGLKFGTSLTYGS